MPEGDKPAPRGLSMNTTRNPLLISIGVLTAVLPTTLLFLSINVLFFVPLVAGLGCFAWGCLRMPESLQPRATAIGIILCLVAAVGPFALRAYGDRSDRPVKVILPVGFRGEFSIVKDREHGQDLKLQDGAWVFEIPPGGVLFVNDDHPFYMWHRESYYYADGSLVPVTSLGTTAGNIDTGPGSSRSSTEYDGTAHRWKVGGDP